MYNLANNAWSRLASSVGANDTTITVASAILFPEPPFVVSIADEILEVTNVSGNTFTVVRGVEGTSSTSYPQGERVDARFTAGVYGGLKDTILNHLEDIDNPHNLLADLIPFSPADPASDWEPTKVADALDILADSRIVEQGENENGEYWRWESGLQVCYVIDIDLQTGFVARNNDWSRITKNPRWNLPATFVSEQYLVYGIYSRRISEAPGNISWGLRSYDLRSSYASVQPYTQEVIDGGTPAIFSLCAIGRWK